MKELTNKALSERQNIKFSYIGKVYRINRDNIKKYDKEILLDIDRYIENLKDIKEYDCAKEYEELKNNYNMTKNTDLLINKYIHEIMDCMPASAIDDMCIDPETEFYSKILQEIPTEVQNLINEFDCQILENAEIKGYCFDIYNKVKEHFNYMDILYSADWDIIADTFWPTEFNSELYN